MTIRIRTIILIIATNLFIIMFSVLAGIKFVDENVRTSQEADLLVASNIAEHFISNEINFLRFKGSAVAQILTDTPNAQWQSILSAQETLYPEFTGMAVLDRGGVIVQAGETPAPPQIIENIDIQQAFNGRQVFSTTMPSTAGMVFYLATPLSNSRILVLTLPGMHFCQLVSTITIWNSGHIFIDDNEGYVIANIREQWVQNRHNFIKLAETEPEYEEVAELLIRVVGGETGVGYFSLAGVPRLCAFRPISASEEGWVMGIIVPLPESPFKNVDIGLLVVGLVALVLSIIAAIIASGFIKKPFEEITVLKEAAESTAFYKSAFLANMSHEMRTPLNTIVGLSNLLMEDTKQSVETREELRKINSAGDHLLGVVNDALDFSKIEAGNLEFNYGQYDTASLLNDIITRNMLRINDRPLKFKVEINDLLPSELYGDELRVKQLFNHLLSNAFKYTKEGTITLKIDYIRRTEKDILMSAVISDTGIGIKQEDIKKLFSDYNQVDVQASRKIAGTGLGLAITKNLIERMGGKISVESIYGVGSSFHVSFLQELVSNKSLGRDTAENLRNFQYIDQKRRASTKLVRPDLSHAKVLVVDDMQTNLDVASGVMRKYNMQVDCVLSGQAAIDKIKSEDPIYDAIFMDHMMPEMDGIEATQLIRALKSDYAKTVPIISLTANAVTGNEQMFLDKGFSAFLSKPINIFKLDEILKKWIRPNPQTREPLPVAAFMPTEQEETKLLQNYIPGVNMDYGLNRYNGEMDMYVSVLKSFVVNTPAVTEILKYLTEETLPKYIINVHGLKGMSAAIAASEVSERAKKLEFMAKDGDLAGVLAENEDFLKQVDVLVADVKNWLDRYEVDR